VEDATADEGAPVKAIAKRLRRLEDGFASMIIRTPKWNY
jgi:hypothetical protein